jgi:hypothetical protein
VQRAELATLAALVVASIAFCLVVFSVTRTLTFYLDDWAFLVSRRDWTLDTFLRPHNQHAAVVPVAIFKVLFELRGATSYGPYAAALLASHAIVVLLVYAVVRRVAPSWWALGSALFVLGLVFADELLFWAFEVSWTVSIAGGLLAWLLWTRPGRWPTDAAAGIALLVSVFSSSIGLIWMAAVSAVMLLGHRTWRRVAVVATVAAVFGLWFLTNGWAAREDSVGADLVLLPEFVARGLGALANAAFALDWRMELVGAMVLSALLGAAVAWARPTGPRFFVAAGALIGLYATIGVARLESFGPGGAIAPRYVYPGAIFLVLAVAEIARAGLPRLRMVPAPVRTGLMAFAALWVCLVLVGNVAKFGRSEQIWTERAASTRVQLAVAGMLRDDLPDPNIPIAPGLTAGLTPAHFSAIVDELGAPVPLDPAWLLARPAGQRQLADATLFRMLRSEIAVLPSEGPAEPAATGTWSAVDGTIDIGAGGCSTLTPTGEDPSASATLASDEEVHLRFRGDRTAVIHLAAFGDAFQADASIELLPDRDRWYVVSLPQLPDPLAWRLRVDPPGGPHSMDLCRVRAATVTGTPPLSMDSRSDGT